VSGDAQTNVLHSAATLSEAHLALATIAQWYDYDWATAEREFKQAIALNPNDPRPHDFYTWFLSPMGRHEEALAEAKRAQQLDPVSPETNIFLGSVLVFARQYAQAIPQLKSAIELDKNYWFGYYFLGRAYEQTGRIPESIEVFQHAIDLEKDQGENWANLGHAYAILGKRAEAQKIIDHLNKLSTTTYIAPYNIAAIYAGLGSKDEAFAALDRAYNERSSMLALYLTNDPRMDSIENSLKIIELDPNFGPAYQYLGLSYLKKGRNAEASAAVKKAGELTKRSGVTLGDLVMSMPSRENKPRLRLSSVSWKINTRGKKRRDRTSPRSMWDLAKRTRHLNGWKEISKSTTIGYLTSDGNFSLNPFATTHAFRICFVEWVCLSSSRRRGHRFAGFQQLAACIF
jgi:tetratricopeptide (TPR) repeat protein